MASRSMAKVLVRLQSNAVARKAQTGLVSSNIEVAPPRGYYPNKAYGYGSSYYSAPAGYGYGYGKKKYGQGSGKEYGYGSGQVYGQSYNYGPYY